MHILASTGSAAWFALLALFAKEVGNFLQMRSSGQWPEKQADEFFGRDKLAASKIYGHGEREARVETHEPQLLSFKCKKREKKKEEVARTLHWRFFAHLLQAECCLQSLFFSSLPSPTLSVW